MIRSEHGKLTNLCYTIIMSSKKVVIIIPTYNEKDNVGPTTKALQKVFHSLKEYQPMILFVDDSSPDGTAQEIIKLQKTYSNVYLFQNKTKKGLGYAYKKGMLYALDKLKADIVFEFDADLSHNPQQIPDMLKAIDQGSGLVLGSRYIRGGGIPANWPFHRKFLSRVGNLFINFILLDFSIKDWTTGYRAIRREVVKKIVPNLKHKAFNGYTWQIGFLVKTKEAGFKIYEVPFHFKDREKGRSKLGPEYIINTMAYIIKVRLQSLLSSRIFKFVMVGGIGALVQLTILQVYRRLMPFQLAFFTAIETSILSNFILSNLWTFADRKLKPSQYPAKFIQFNLTSAGSIIIQQIIAILGEHFIGLHPLFTFSLSPLISHLSLPIDTGTMYAVTGILIGMFWNFFAYTRLIWKKKH